MISPRLNSAWRWFYGVVVGGFLLFFGVPVLVGLVVYGLGSLEQREVKSELQARGESLVREESEPPLAPAEDFFADAVWTELVEQPEADSSWNQLCPPPTQAEREAIGRVWPEASLSQSGEGRAALVESIWKIAPGSGEDQRRAAESTLAVLRPAAPLFARLDLLAQRPGARFPMRRSAGGMLRPSGPCWTALDAAASMLAHRARASLLLGDSASASADILLVWRLAAAQKARAFPWMTPWTAIDLGLREMQTGLARHQWTAAQLAEFEKRLQGFDVPGDLAGIMRGQRVLVNENGEYRKANPQSLVHLIRAERHPRWRQIEVLAEYVSIRATMPHGQAALNREIQQSIDALATGKIDPLPWPESGAISPRKIRTYYDAEEGFIRAIIKRDARQAAWMQTRITQGLAACALERYWQNTGSYPAQLTELIPQYLSDLPLDIIDHEPLRYRRISPGEYRLYSVGPDRVDDAGKAMEFNRGDWIWGWPDS